MCYLSQILKWIHATFYAVINHGWSIWLNTRHGNSSTVFELAIISKSKKNSFLPWSFLPWMLAALQLQKNNSFRGTYSRKYCMWFLIDWVWFAKGSTQNLAKRGVPNFLLHFSYHSTNYISVIHSLPQVDGVDNFSSERLWGLQWICILDGVELSQIFFSTQNLERTS